MWAMMCARLRWTVLGFGLVVGCSGSSGQSASTWGGRYAASICARIFGCCSASEAAQLGYTSEAQCASTIGSQQQTSVDQVLSSGLARYDEAVAPTCINDIAAVSCGALFANLGRLSAPVSCSRVFVGTGQTGAPCGGLDFSCESDNCASDYCAPPSCRTVICPAGQYCDATSLGCVPGQAAGATCTSNAECDPSIVCRAATCGPPLPDQSPCVEDSDCTSGACLPNSGQTSGSACGTPQPDGSPCTGAGECQSGACNYASSGATCGAPFCQG
jgi:hypothetical protein